MLFDVKKAAPPVATTKGEGVVDPSQQYAQPFGKLQDVVQLVDHGRTVHWISNGEWSMHQLLQALLEKTGPASVWLSSYAFSEMPARIIAELKRTGMIRKLYCVVDSRVDVRSASAHTLIQNTSDACKLTNTHAKVTVLRNEKWFLVVVGSANYTTNKRYEAGAITTDSIIANFHQKWITDELTGI